MDDLTTLEPGDEGRAEDVGELACLTIIHHPNAARVGERAFLPGLHGAGTVEVSRVAPRFEPVEGGEGTPLADPFLSRSPLWIALSPDHVHLDRTGTSTRVVVEGQELGDHLRLPRARLRERGLCLVLGQRIVLLLHVASPDVRHGEPIWGLLGASRVMVGVRQQVAKVARQDVPVLLEGPSGSGKELVARAIHAASGRKGDFVSVNMAALTESMAAAALFGHERGAFTGAVRASRGYFGAAVGGTLFLDEIGETSSVVQPALLRAVESGEVQPVGAERAHRVDIRLITATDSTLGDVVQAGGFRGPLLHRLNTYTIRLPSLRERLDDLGRLLQIFLRQELEAVGRSERLLPRAGREEPWLPASLVAALMAHAWPGNVRELRNVARRIVIEASDQERVTLQPLALLSVPGGRAGAQGSSSSEPVAPAQPRRAVEPGHDQEGEQRGVDAPLDDAVVEAALEAHGFKPGAAARALGISRTTLYGWMEASPRMQKAADLAGETIEAALRGCGGDLSAAAAQLRVSERGLKLRMTALKLVLEGQDD